MRGQWESGEARHTRPDDSSDSPAQRHHQALHRVTPLLCTLSTGLSLPSTAYALPVNEPCIRVNLVRHILHVVPGMRRAAAAATRATMGAGGCH